MGSPVRSAPTRADETLGELLEARLVHQDALGGDAGLAGVEVAAGDAALHRAREVGVGLDDDRGVAAQLERHPLGVRALADGPAGTGRAGEGDHPDARVVEQRRGVVVGAEQDGERARGVAGSRLTISASR